ncbi:hypothetical protein F2Q70_00028492 [Brassica cretica]|uniref:BAG domain-containing protein n=1 Tax=Brassica cretica TaxID=69181 RepID=A0A8S9LDD6_BRACR|nr:hypothetical protein F2Q70_00028492 [Brassica cretica]
MSLSPSPSPSCFVSLSLNRAQSMIQWKESVDAIRTNRKERLRMNETLMSLLLKLDSIPGLDPTIRETQRKVSRQIVGTHEILDAISGCGPLVLLLT